MAPVHGWHANSRSVQSFQQYQVTVQQYPCNTVNRQGCMWICCLLAQVTSSQGLLQVSRAVVWQGGEGANEWQLSATTSKCWRFSYTDFFIQVQCYVSVFLRKTHIEIGAIQRRIAWPLCKDETQIRETFQNFSNFKRQCSNTLVMSSAGRDAHQSAFCWLKLPLANN